MAKGELKYNDGIEAAAGYHDEQSKRHREKGTRDGTVMALLHKRYAAAIRELKKDIS